MIEIDWISYALGFITLFVINLILTPILIKYEKDLKKREKDLEERMNKVLKEIDRYENQVEQAHTTIKEMKAGLGVKRKCPNCGYTLPLLEFPQGELKKL